MDSPGAHGPALNGHSVLAAKKVTPIEHPLARHSLSLLQDTRTAAHLLRPSSIQLLTLLLVEATRSRSAGHGSGSESGQSFARPLILLSITRAGIGLAHRMAEIFSPLLVGAVSFNGDTSGHHADARLHLSSAPPLSEAHVLLFNPIVTTGSSSGSAIRLLQRSGATKISLLTFAIAEESLERLTREFASVTVLTSSISNGGSGRQSAAEVARLMERFQA